MMPKVGALSTFVAPVTLPSLVFGRKLEVLANLGALVGPEETFYS